MISLLMVSSVLDDGSCIWRVNDSSIRKSGINSVPAQSYAEAPQYFYPLFCTFEKIFRAVQDAFFYKQETLSLE